LIGQFWIVLRLNQMINVKKFWVTYKDVYIWSVVAGIFENNALCGFTDGESGLEVFGK
jgi:hypothetical protein